MEWSSETIAMVALLIGVLLFLWRLHGDVRGLDRDMRTLSDRIARVEGLLEGLRDSITGQSRPASP
jgi:hypothetical protein